MIILPVSFTELLPLQILYIFVSPLSAVGHNTSILVVGSFHHTSCSIHLTSFTISNRLYWIHRELVCCQVAHIWSIGSPTGWFVGLSPSSLFFCGWSSGNGETKKQECAKKNNTPNRKLKINTLNFLENNPTVSLNCYLYKFFTFWFHHCQLLVITHPSWLLDHFTIQVVVSISHLSPFPTVFTEFTLNWSVVK